jgi:hypothetical protein
MLKKATILLMMCITPRKDSCEIQLKCAMGLVLTLTCLRDIHEAYRMNGDMIYGTHMVHMSSPEREEACLVSSHYVLCLESAIVVLNIDCSSQDTIHLYGHVRPS